MMLNVPTWILDVGAIPFATPPVETMTPVLVGLVALLFTSAIGLLASRDRARPTPVPSPGRGGLRLATCALRSTLVAPRWRSYIGKGA